MAGYSAKWVDAEAVVDQIIPASNAAGALLTGAIDLSKYRRFVFIIPVGVIGSNTVDFAVQWSATSAGTYATLTGTSIAQVKTANSNGSKVQVVEVSTEQIINQQSGATFIKGLLTTGTSNVIACVVVIGLEPRFLPPTAGTAQAQAVSTLA